MEIHNDYKLKYLNRRMSEIEELKAGLASNNFDTVAAIGHRLKGNGQTFGFPVISSIGISLEEAASLKDKSKLKELIEKLILCVEEGLKQIQ